MSIGAERGAAAAVAGTGPSLASRIYGLGSVFGKSLRDSRFTILGVGLVLGLLTLVTIAAIAVEFDTPAERAALARQMELLPAVFQGLLGKPIEIETLPGFLSWRLVGVMPLMVGIWSIVALAGTVAGEAAGGTLEVVLATPISRHSLAVQKFLAHVVALGLALAIVSLIAWISTLVLAALPGDELGIVAALSEFGLVGAISLLAGSIAFAASMLFGRSIGAGIAGGYLFGAFAINGYSSLVPGFDILRLGSVFYWTANHRPLAGVSDWPAVGLVVGMTAVLAVLGVVLFMRRDLSELVGVPERVRAGGRRLGLGRLGLGRLSVGRWSLSGPGARSFADRLPEAIGWGGAMGAYGLFVAFSADAFAQVINSVPQIAEMVRVFYPEVDFSSVGGIIQFAVVAFITLVIGLASATLVGGWSSDERERRLEMVLAAPINRLSWFLRSGAGVLLAVMLTGLLVGLGPAIGALAQGDPALSLIGGGLVLGLYGSALVGAGFVVAGAGRPGWAALTVGGLTLAFYLIDLLGTVLRLSPDVLNISLTRHLGQPMAGSYDVPGIVACLLLAAGGLLLGSWLFARRDLRG